MPQFIYDMSTLCSLKVVLPSSSPGLRSGIASLSTALRGFATARQQTSSDIQAAVKTLMRDITAKENEDVIIFSLVHIIGVFRLAMLIPWLLTRS